MKNFPNTKLIYSHKFLVEIVQIANKFRHLGPKILWSVSQNEKSDIRVQKCQKLLSGIALKNQDIRTKFMKNFQWRKHYAGDMGLKLAKIDKLN